MLIKVIRVLVKAVKMVVISRTDSTFWGGESAYGV
jgi:hypothetical protein